MLSIIVTWFGPPRVEALKVRGRSPVLPSQNVVVLIEFPGNEPLSSYELYLDDCHLHLGIVHNRGIDYVAANYSGLLLIQTFRLRVCEDAQTLSSLAVIKAELTCICGLIQISLCIYIYVCVYVCMYVCTRIWSCIPTDLCKACFRCLWLVTFFQPARCSKCMCLLTLSFTLSMFTADC